ncbi:intraflagellar transport protein 172 homolog [Cimex lectularius]|uniref:Intraflagellar transport protein 172 homolog n=1 Tax=Cimex lectularius TaxID=79782 RepID=A0A8I6RC65_CIMLE|nr:intraflagellar transport protein 172 homolog [Cimex lectularius]XP_024085751.1 intraflagellar transport protein 172 homolog [Cimex lectularius]
MQLKHLRNILQAKDAPMNILAIAWSPNNLKLAVCNYDRCILLFDENGNRKDKFPTKPANSKNGRMSYTVKGLAFSPDSNKIAVGQTDNIIYIYKLGDDWGDKKVICSKFPQQSPVTCLIWLSEGPIIFGQADGKVRAAHLASNKTQTLFSANSFVVSLASNVRGTGFLSGHADGSIIRYYVAEDSAMEKQCRVVMHTTPPYALAWPTGGFVLAAGCDRKVAVYDTDGHLFKQFDYANEKEFTVAACSPSGQAVAVGSFNRIRTYTWSPRKVMWEEMPVKEIENLYTITALSWKRDGSRVTCGSLCGSVELFESVIKRMIWKNKFELTYVGASQVLVKPLDDNSRGVILRSRFGYEIDDVRILGNDRYLVARTPETLLLGDLHRNLLSEVNWTDTGSQEKFYLDNPNVCLIFNVGELTLVEYGNNKILASVRTEFMNPHLISVRLNERKHPNSTDDNKKLAYLLDRKTICIVDLVFGIPMLQVSHDSKIDWLELNETSHKLLFRDKKMRLTLLDTRTGERQVILSYCTYVQWVPGSDVVVAQSRNNACIWYNIDTPERVTNFPVKGEIVDIVRENKKTEIVAQEGTHQVGYQLDEGLVEFGTAVHDSDFGRAILFLESLGPSSTETEAMWHNLAEITLQLNNLRVALRCYAALGDIPKTHFLNETLKIAEDFARTNGGDGMDCPEVWARMAILNKQLKTAEAVYLEQNQLDKALDMYKQLHKWDEAISLAEASGYTKLSLLKNEYVIWLMKTGQQEKAGQVKQESGQYTEAIDLYLSAGLPAAAGRLVVSKPELLEDSMLLKKITAELTKAELYQQAGQVYEAAGDNMRAMQCYRKGNAFATALHLARFVAPQDVVALEEEWGDYLLQSKQLDAAINHYIESGKTMKALDAAIVARQWKKAVQILQAVHDISSVATHYAQLCQHFASVKDYQVAEKLFIQAGRPEDGVKMYFDAGEWEKAYNFASAHLESSLLNEIMLRKAQECETMGKYKDAETLYVLAGQVDSAIAMYKNQRQHDQMLKLVKEYRSDLLNMTNLHLAKQLEDEGNILGAEELYVAAGEWTTAVNMLRSHGMWEQAYKVAKQGGGEQSARHVLFAWAKSLGGDSAVKLLNRYDLLSPCIEYACDSNQFEFAFDLAKTGLKTKMAEIHHKYALYLEAKDELKLAEQHFLKSGKVKDAVMMYMDHKRWDDAERLAETLKNETLMQEVLHAQATDEFRMKNFEKFETLNLRAHKPEAIVQMYKDAGMWMEALRVCRDYLPTKLAIVQAEYDKMVGNRGARDVTILLNEAKQWESSGQYITAVKCYLKVNVSNCQDASTIVKALTEAARITNNYLDGDEATEVTRILGARLVEMKQHNMAAQLYMAVDMVKEALDTLIANEDWQKALKIVKDIEPSFEPYVESRYKESLRSQGRADQLADVDIISGLDLLCEQGQWQRAIDMAKSNGIHVLNKYLALYAAHLIKSGSAMKALDLYAQHGAAPLPQNYNIYRTIASQVISTHTSKETYKSWAKLRDLFFEITENMSNTPDANTPTQTEFETIMMIGHYYALRSALRYLSNTDKLVAKISISLLRYSDIIPADKAYFEAGMDAKEVGMNTDAFVFLNHCLDVIEAMEDGGGAIDHSDLLVTDFPQQVPLPESNYLRSDEIEAVKDWVLSVSVDRSVDMALPIDDRGVYPASLTGLSGAPAQPCLVTGYPVLHKHVRFRRGAANTEDYSALQMTSRMHPTDNSLADVISFLGKWAGPPSEMSLL